MNVVRRMEGCVIPYLDVGRRERRGHGNAFSQMSD